MLVVFSFFSGFPLFSSLLLVIHAILPKNYTGIYSDFIIAFWCSVLFWFLTSLHTTDSISLVIHTISIWQNVTNPPVFVVTTWLMLYFVVQTHSCITFLNVHLYHMKTASKNFVKLMNIFHLFVVMMITILNGPVMYLVFRWYWCHFALT